MTEPDSEDGFFKRFATRPVVPFLGFIFGVVGIGGIGFTIWSYFASQRSRELTYYVHPARAAVVVPGQVSNLKVEHEGQEIREGMTVTLLAIWNAGALEIEAQDVLQPILIYTEPAVPILEATVRKPPRDETDFRLSTAKLKEGIVTVSWKILEKNDGAWVQIIHTGGTEVEIRARGTIKGQGPITRMYYRGKIQSAEEQLRKEARSSKMSGYLFVAFGVLGLALVVWAKRKLFGGPLDAGDWLILSTFLFVVAAGVYFIFWSKSPGPPFGF